MPISSRRRAIGSQGHFAGGRLLRAGRARALVGLLGAALGSSFASTALATPALDLPVESHRLPNGMRVVLAPDASLGDVTVAVRYGVGSADDPAGKDGLAHLVEHLMFAGSRHVARGEFARRLHQAGASNVNGSTSLDATLYTETVAPQQLPLVFWLESDRMGFAIPHVDANVLELERDLIGDELWGRTLDANLGSLQRLSLLQVFPAWHPYARGHDNHSLGDITAADVRAFIRTWYTPSNATLIVAGQFDPVPTLALARSYFGDLPATAPPVRPVLPSFRQADVRLEMAASAPHDSVLMLWQAPPYRERDDLALDLAAVALTGVQGRLQRQLVASGKALEVWSSEKSMQRASVFSIFVSVAQDVPADTIVRTVDTTLREMHADLTAEECERSRRDRQATDLLRLETSLGRAGRLAGQWHDESLSVAEHAAVQLTDVKRVVRSTLGTPGRAVIVVRHDARYPARGLILDRYEQAQ